MRIILIALLIVGVLFAVVITDRDRSLWVLNSAIKTVSSNMVVSDIPYGEQNWQKLDVHTAQPSKSESIKNAPVIVFFHGGGWYHGRKDQYRFAADAFVRQGYTVVLPDYVKYPSPEAVFPAHLVDAAKTLAWVKQNIHEYNGDPKNVFVSGHSAGAHTVALLITDKQYLNDQGLSPKDIRGAAPIAGPYQFTPDTPANKAVFAPATNYPLMNPLTYIDGDEPAVILLHSENDSSIPMRHLHEFSQAMQSAGGVIKTKTYETLSHVDMVTHLHPWFARDESIADEIDNFFKTLIR